MSDPGLERFEKVVGRTVDTVRRLKAEAESSRRENESLRVQVKELKERLVSLKQTTGSQTDARRIRQLEKERRELRGRVASLLRLADSLLEEGR